MNVGAPPPREPVELKAGKGVAEPWADKRARFAAFMVANFVPWECGTTAEACRPPELTAESLEGWQRHLRDVATAPEASRERSIARGRLFALRQYANALDVDSSQKQAQTQWRSRNRTMWPAETNDEDEKKVGGGTKAGVAGTAAEEIMQFAEGQRSLAIDPERVTHHAEQEAFVETALCGMGLEMPPAEDSTLPASHGSRAYTVDVTNCGVIDVTADLVKRTFKGMQDAPVGKPRHRRVLVVKVGTAAAQVAQCPPSSCQ